MQNTSKVTKELTDAIEEVLQNFANVFNTKDAPKVENKKPEDPDDVLKKFLKDFGLWLNKKNAWAEAQAYFLYTKYYIQNTVYNKLLYKYDNDDEKICICV